MDSLSGPYGSSSPRASRVIFPATKGSVVLSKPYAYAKEHRLPQDPEMQTRARRVAEVFSEALIVLGNEPSLGLYRVQEHIRRSVPGIVDHKKDLTHLHQQVQGVCFDTDYAGSVVEQMKSITHFSTIQEHLNCSIGIKQVLDERGLLDPNQDTRAAASPNTKTGATRPISVHQPSSSLHQSFEDSSGASPSVQKGPSNGTSTLLFPKLSTEGAMRAAAQRSAQSSGELTLEPKKF